MCILLFLDNERLLLMITVPLLEPIRDTLGKVIWSSRYFSNRDSLGVQCVVPGRDFDLLCTPQEIPIPFMGGAWIF